MMGPGKYDAEAEALLRSLGANAVVLVVVGGKKKPGGMSVSQELGPEWSVVAAAEFLAGLPRLLRILADNIDRDIAARPH
jgi:hypothetical protein